MKDIYTKRRIGGRRFILAEHIDNYIEAQVAASEYRCEGLLVRVQVVEVDMLYYIWTGTKRKRKPALLPGEKVRRGGTRILRASHGKRAVA